MGKCWVDITSIVDFTGELQLGFIVRFWRERGSRCAGAGLRLAEEYSLRRRSFLREFCALAGGLPRPKYFAKLNNL